MLRKALLLIVRSHEYWIPLAAFALGAFLVHASQGSPDGRWYFAWPRGWIWPGLLSTLIWTAAAAFLLLLWRRHVGRRLARWYHHHVLPHIEEPVAQREARDAIHAAHRISADIYRAVNGGTDHPDAPAPAPAHDSGEPRMPPR